MMHRYNEISGQRGNLAAFARRDRDREIGKSEGFAARCPAIKIAEASSNPSRSSRGAMILLEIRSRDKSRIAARRERIREEERSRLDRLPLVTRARGKSGRPLERSLRSVHPFRVGIGGILAARYNPHAHPPHAPSSPLLSRRSHRRCAGGGGGRTVQSGK